MSSLEKHLFWYVVHVLTGLQECTLKKKKKRMRNNKSCVVGTGRSLALDSAGHWGRAEQERVQDKNSVEVGNSIRVFIIVWMRVLSYTEITLSAMYCVCVHVCSVTPDSATQWKAANQAPLSMKFSRQRLLEWVAKSYSRESSWPRDQTRVSWIARWILYHCATYF